MRRLQTQVTVISGMPWCNFQHLTIVSISPMAIKSQPSFIFVEYEDDQYRLEHDTPELGLDSTNVARVSQQVARDILIRFSKEHTVILDDHWKQEKVR